MGKSTADSTDQEAKATTPKDWYALARAVQVYGGAKHYRGGAMRVLSRNLASLAFRGLLDSVLLTSRFELVDEFGVEARLLAGEPLIGAIWHQRLLGGVLYARHKIFRPSLPFAVRAMISESDDGELVARLFRDFGGNVIRGSTSRGGPDALRAMVRDAKRPGICVLTPDGPRGPKEQAQEGVFALARLSGVPIVPLHASFGRALRFARSWDGFLVPLPFAKVRVAFGEPLEVGKRDSIESAKEEFQRRMAALAANVIVENPKEYRIGRPRPSQ